MPDDPTLQDHLGDIQEALQNVAGAIAHWQQSLRFDPANDTVAGKLQAHGIDPAAIRAAVAVEKAKAGQKPTP